MAQFPDLCREKEIASDLDIIECRQLCRMIAQRLGFGQIDQARITTAVSELARNIYLYAGKGIVHVRTVQDAANAWGIEIVCVDRGPGIPDVDAAMRDGYSTSSGMGMGLPGAKRLMDEFDLQTEIGVGTTVVIRKWRR